MIEFTENDLIEKRGQKYTALFILYYSIYVFMDDILMHKVMFVKVAQYSSAVS